MIVDDIDRFPESRACFVEALDREEGKIDLIRANLLIAKCVEYPDLDIDEYLARFEKMASEIQSRLDSADRGPRSLIHVINRYLFASQGFHGNENDYYDPRNSFLNDVMDRRTGIPITMSTLFIELAGRTGLALEGVGFPGHFVVKYSGPGFEFLIDPFNKGRMLSENDCQDILDRIYGGGVEFRSEMLATVTKKQIIGRMLSNLKGIYVDSKNYQKALWVVELILDLSPGNALEIRDRGLLYHRLECFSRALHDLETYLNLRSDAPDGEAMIDFISRLRDLVKSIN